MNTYFVEIWDDELEKPKWSQVWFHADDICPIPSQSTSSLAVANAKLLQMQSNGWKARLISRRVFKKVRAIKIPDAKVVVVPKSARCNRCRRPAGKMYGEPYLCPDCAKEIYEGA